MIYNTHQTDNIYFEAVNSKKTNVYNITIYKRLS